VAKPIVDDRNPDLLEVQAAPPTSACTRCGSWSSPPFDLDEYVYTALHPRGQVPPERTPRRPT
jgi:hypothetical protein